MHKKKFVEPSSEIIRIDGEDIITTSISITPEPGQGDGFDEDL